MICLVRSLTLSLALLLLLTGCGAKEPTDQPATGQVVLTLVDLSGSADAVRAKYLAQTEQILASVPAGARFLLLPISAQSLTTPAAVDITFPTYTWWKTNTFTHSREMARLRQEATAQIEALLQDAPGSRGTSLLDSLKQAETFLADYPEGAGGVYILSDMVEQSDLLDLYSLTDQEVVPALARVKEEERVPNLHGARVTVAGLEAAKSLPPARVRAIQSFWEGLFESAGAKLQRYSPTLQVP